MNTKCCDAALCASCWNTKGDDDLLKCSYGEWTFLIICPYFGSWKRLSWEENVTNFTNRDWYASELLRLPHHPKWQEFRKQENKQLYVVVDCFYVTSDPNISLGRGIEMFYSLKLQQQIYVWNTKKKSYRVSYRFREGGNYRLSVSVEGAKKVIAHPENVSKVLVALVQTQNWKLVLVLVWKKKKWYWAHRIAS